MADERLTQEQINALIEGGAEAIEELLSEDEKREQYRPYDFDRPVKFNLENIRSLKAIANVFSRGFSQIMSASLRYPITFKLNKDNPIEQVPYASEYIEKMLKDYSAFCITDLGNKDLGMIIVEFDLALVMPIHRNMLGAGKNIELDEERKPLTEIEKLSMKEWVQDKVFPQLEEAFQNIAQFNLKLANIETDPQYIKITRPNDMIALISFDIEYGPDENKKTHESVMKLCIPYLSIEKIIDRLTTENATEYSFDKSEIDQTELIKNHLNFVKRKVEVELGKSKITIREILALEETDVLVLDKKIDDQLIGYISNKPKFSCVAGRSGIKKAVKITGLAKKEVPHNE